MPDVLEMLAEALEPILLQQKARKYGLKHDASGTPISVGYSHGPGGIFTFPGVDPDIFHTIVSSQSMLGQLPSMPSLYTNPTYYTLTGIQDVSGSNKSGVCDDAPTAGLAKACLTTSVFGRYELATPELELNRLGARVDRADPMDLRLIGSPIAAQGPFAVGPEGPSAPADVLLNEVSRKFWERNVAFHRLLAVQLWRGNPTNNAALGGYKEMTGFDQLINTGYVDAETNQACAAMDSYLDATVLGRIDQNGTAVVAHITNMFYQVRDRAERMGMMPVRWVFAMRPQLFYELTAIWPCSYLTYRCQVQGNERVTINAEEQVKMRDEMRAGKYLLIDGIRMDVLVDDGITELDMGIDGSGDAAGCFQSDIYLIPMSVVGGRAVTFLEYFQYQNPSLQDALGNLILGRVEGAFLTWPRQTNQCVVWQSKVEPRLVLRTPWLAARLVNVRYCPLQHTRDAFPSNPYFVDGGRTSRPGPSYYTVWMND